MTTLTNPTSLPAPVERYLADFVARRRRLLVLRALGVAVAGVLGWMLVVCLIDRVAPLGRWVRGTALICGACAFAIVVVRPVLYLLARRFSPVTAAEDAERFNPTLDQRLVTVVSQAYTPAGQRGSPHLLAHLTAQLSGELTSGAIVGERGRASRPWLAVVLLTLLIGSLSSVPGLGVPRLIQRFVNPWEPLPAVTTTRLDVQPGSVAVIEGRAEVVSVIARRLEGPPPAIHISDDGGRSWSATSMTPTSTSMYAYRFASVDRDLSYNVTGGDATSPTYNVHVLRVPAVEKFQIRYTYPPYTHLAPAVVTNATGAIDALVGTTVDVRIRATEPLREAKFVVGGTPVATTPTDDPAVRDARFTVTRDETLVLRLTATTGVDGAGPPKMAIHAVPDRPPVVRLIRPLDGTRVTPDMVVPVEFEAADDYGVSSVVLHLAKNDGAATPTALPLSGEGAVQRGSGSIDLKTLGASVGDVVSLWLEARDAQGQRGRSDERQLLVVANTIDVHARQRLAALTAAADEAGLLTRELDAAREALSAATKPTDGRGADPSAATRHLVAAAEQAAAIEANLLRVTIHSGSPRQAVALANLLDTIETAAADIDVAQASRTSTADETQAVSAKLAETSAAGGRAAAQLRVLAAAEQAAAVLVDRRNIPTTTTTAPAWRRAADDVNAAVRGLGLDPLATDLDARLRELMTAGDALIGGQQPVDFVSASRLWAQNLWRASAWPLALDRRLAMAAKAEAVRPDADAVWAQDLRLASAAAAKLSSPEGRNAIPTTQPEDDPRVGYPAALEALKREHERHEISAGDEQQAKVPADRARERLRRWAGEDEPVTNAEEAGDASRAFELALAANAATANHAYDEAQRLDDVRRRLLSSSKVQDASGIPADPTQPVRAIDALRGDQTRLQSALQSPKDAASPAEILAGQWDFVAKLERAAAELARSGTTLPALADAQAHAKSVSAALAAVPADYTEARRQQQAVDGALAHAWRAAAQDAGSRRLASVPGLSQLFAVDPAAGLTGGAERGALGASGTATGRDWARLRNAADAKLNRGVRETTPSGYEDALRVYFETLAQSRPPAPTTTEGK